MYHVYVIRTTSGIFYLIFVRPDCAGDSSFCARVVHVTYVH